MTPDRTPRLAVLRNAVKAHLEEGRISFWTQRGRDRAYEDLLTKFDVQGDSLWAIPGKRPIIRAGPCCNEYTDRTP